jgi:uncharacterized membrane protein
MRRISKAERATVRQALRSLNEELTVIIQQLVACRTTTKAINIRPDADLVQVMELEQAMLDVRRKMLRLRESAMLLAAFKNKMSGVE